MAATMPMQVFADHAAKADTQRPAGLDPVSRPQDLLIGDINTKVDRASMAHSLEVREPLMDHKLVEWLATLPSTEKIRGQETKYLLKKSMEPLPPQRCALSPQNGLLGAARPLVPRPAQGPRVQDALLGPRLAATGWFNREYYFSTWSDAHNNGSRDYSASIWAHADVRSFPAQRHGARQHPA